MNDSGKTIAVIGAGIMGLSVAHALRRYGVSVFDPKGFPADNASFMAGGMLAPYSEIEYMPPEFMEAAQRGIQIWKDILPDINQRGSLLVAHKDDEYILERLAEKLKILNAGERLSTRRINELEPALNGRFNDGLYLPQEANIDPQAAMRFLADTLKDKRTEEANAQKLARDFDYVIDCRGFAAEKDDKELRGVKGEIVFVRNTEFSLSRPVRLMHPRYPLYIVPRPDNVFMIGATIIESEDDGITLKSALELLSAAYSLHPSFAEAEILELRAGIRPAYPDNLPRVEIDANIIRCNGLFRHGYLLAPVMASCVHDFLAAKENIFMNLFKNDKAPMQKASEF